MGGFLISMRLPRRLLNNKPLNWPTIRLGIAGSGCDKSEEGSCRRNGSLNRVTNRLWGAGQ